MVNVGKYTIHGSYALCSQQKYSKNVLCHQRLQTKTHLAGSVWGNDAFSSFRALPLAGRPLGRE